MKNKKNKDTQLGPRPMEELLPFTVHKLETLWDMLEEEKGNCIKLEDERMARLLKKKLKDEYEKSN